MKRAVFLPVLLDSANPVEVAAIYPVHTLSSYILNNSFENRYLGNGIFFKFPLEEERTYVISCFKGEAHWVDGGKSHEILPTFTPENDSIILDIAPPRNEKVLWGQGICFPRPSGYVTFENVDREFTEFEFPEIFTTSVEVHAGDVISRAARVVPTDVDPGQQQDTFRGFVLKMWKPSQEATEFAQIVYPHVYLHHFRFFNHEIGDQNPVYDTLRFGLSGSVGEDKSPDGFLDDPPFNHPHDIFITYHRFLDLGFTYKPFPHYSEWKITDGRKCPHNNGECTDQERHPPAFEHLSIYHEGVSPGAGPVNATSTLRFDPSSASQMEGYYTGMPIEITSGPLKGERSRILAYSNGIAGVNPPWSQEPEKGTQYRTFDFRKSLVAVIELFQAILRNRKKFENLPGVDGEITVKKDKQGQVEGRYFTEKWLWADEAPAWRELGSGKPGTKFAYQESDGRDREERNLHDLEFNYGTNYLENAIKCAGAHYYDNYYKEHPAKAIINTNDASYRAGGYVPRKEHRWHNSGLDVDVRLPRTTLLNGSFNTGGVNIGTPEYDGPDRGSHPPRKTAFAICDAFANAYLMREILFNDQKINEGNKPYREGTISKAPAATEPRLNWIELEDGASSTVDEYKNMILKITSGPGLGAARKIVKYDGTSKRVTLDRDWDPAALPDTTSKYLIDCSVPMVHSSSRSHDNHIHVRVKSPSFQEANPKTWTAAFDRLK